jgi:dimethylhistidine N-methyltransferase
MTPPVSGVAWALRPFARPAWRARPDRGDDFSADVAAGLSAMPKRLPAKWFYDAAGSRLFEAITRLPEYYPTRTEMGILADRGAEIAALVPGGAALVEFGSGSSAKVRILLASGAPLSAYVPVDISAEFVRGEAARLRAEFPRLGVSPVAADFTRDFVLPPATATMPRVGFFPGSTIGNFEPHEAAAFLTRCGRILGSGALMLVGVDRVKARAVLEAAYDDAAGITARFNLNLLRRINRELAGSFDLSSFRHHAWYNAARARIEMHLVSRRAQTVAAAGRRFHFRAGESIHTENSYKYTNASFMELARRAGWRPVRSWTDAKRWFAVHALRWPAD